MTLAHTDTLVHDSHYMDRLPRLAEQIAHSQLCPAPWRIEHGDTEPIVERKIADLAIVGMSLAELDMRLSVNTLPQVYVVHGRPGYMAQIQITLAARHGCRIVPLDDASDNTVGTVKAFGKDGQWHIVTVTIADAVKAGWTKPKKRKDGSTEISLYETMPDRMLMARAVTKAIGLHCPEAKLLLPDPDTEYAGAIVDRLATDDGQTAQSVENPRAPRARALASNSPATVPPLPLCPYCNGVVQGPFPCCQRMAQEIAEATEPTADLVPPLEAKLALVDAFTNIGYTHTYAVTSASIVWHAQFRPHERIKRSELDILLQAIADQPHTTPDEPEPDELGPQRPFDI